MSWPASTSGVVGCSSKVAQPAEVRLMHHERVARVRVEP